MNFREVVDFLSHEDMTETVVSPDETTILTGLETLVRQGVPLHENLREDARRRYALDPLDAVLLRPAGASPHAGIRGYRA